MMNIFMNLFSRQNTSFGRFQARERPNFIRKKIISPVLERENPAQRNVLTYNKQTILMPPVKKSLNLSFNKIKVGRGTFLKDKTQQERFLQSQPERDSTPNKEVTAVISPQNNTGQSDAGQRQPLKERIKIFEIQLSRSEVRDWSTVDMMAAVPLCRSTKYLQKYGCFHTDPVSNRWRV